MQLKTSINTLPTTHLTSEVFKMIEDELEKFQNEADKYKNLRLLVDFEPTNKLELSKNQMEIGSIKYKKVIAKKGSEIDLKKRKKPNDDNSLF